MKTKNLDVTPGFDCLEMLRDVQVIWIFLNYFQSQMVNAWVTTDVDWGVELSLAVIEHVRSWIEITKGLLSRSFEVQALPSLLVTIGQVLDWFGQTLIVTDFFRVLRRIIFDVLFEINS